MPVLKNSKHERFALASFQGMTGKDAAIQAGYIYKNDRVIIQTGSRLLTYVDIQARVKELHEEVAELAKSDAVMDDKEITEKLSEIGREDIQGKYGPLRQPNISAMREINLMRGAYPPSKVELGADKELGAALSGLLERLRGYKDADRPS